MEDSMHAEMLHWLKRCVPGWEEMSADVQHAILIRVVRASRAAFIAGATFGVTATTTLNNDELFRQLDQRYPVPVR
jgi:hypothetical protein